jgi:hypothetical protein
VEPPAPSQLQSLSTHAGDQDVIARIWEDPIRAAQAAASEYPDPSAHDAASFRRRLSHRIVEELQDRGNPDVGIIAVMVEGTPFTEDVEVRLRIRYALEAALLEEGFVPDDRTRIGFVKSRGRNRLGSAHGRDFFYRSFRQSTGLSAR